MRARVSGGGLAALCAARVLLARGWTVHLAPADPRPRPTILLGPVTVDFLTRLFDDLDPLFAEAHPLRWRHTRWGIVAAASTVDAPVLVVREARLIEILGARLTMSGGGRLHIDDAAVPPADVAEASRWVVSARGREGVGARPRQWFGVRRMIAAEFQLCRADDDASAWIETTPEGWVFMAPTGGGGALVQAMVTGECAAPLERLQAIVALTRDIGLRLAAPLGEAQVFAAAPSMANRLCEPGRIAAGDEAMTLDPVCGDGVGYAIRGALLAAATVDGIARGLDETMGFGHYHARLATTLAHHVRACLAFYDSDHLNGGWAAERLAGRRALALLEERLATWPGFRLGLRGFSLAPLVAASPA